MLTLDLQASLKLLAAFQYNTEPNGVEARGGLRTQNYQYILNCEAMVKEAVSDEPSAVSLVE
jgi:tRNA 2-selenouridine synthase SelU